ncbi:Hypothetical predicted protein [Paramuricea clavata]|uniref:Uncharacterized protein n=1 Tax=Paramuricea clavata TaxID=317549 RepID=A0A6S7GAK1_PARCT|nr:Hypothetical predicted protein [Paramuricea clavata]
MTVDQPVASRVKTKTTRTKCVPSHVWLDVNVRLGKFGIRRSAFRRQNVQIQRNARRSCTEARSAPSKLVLVTSKQEE